MTRRAAAASAKEARVGGETDGGPGGAAHPRAARHDERAAAPARHPPDVDTAQHGTSRAAAHRATIGAMRDPFDQDEPERDTPDGERPEPLSPDDPLAPLPFNPYKGNRGLTRAWHALKNSVSGIRVAIREESAFRQELALAAILVPCGIFVPVAPVERAALLSTVLLVLIVELLNSSVEAAIDRISLERHELSKRAKDFGSAAVLLALAVCVMTWALIVGPVVGPFVWQWLTRIS